MMIAVSGALFLCLFLTRTATCATSLLLTTSTNAGAMKGTAGSSSESTTTPTPALPQKRTFYKRSLPDSCVAFSSRKGRSYFESAMRNRGMRSFFTLMEQHSTQTEPAFCGLSTLVIVLNALAVDPRRTWKASWRWYEESMLNCCLDLEQIKQTGITLKAFNCLASCQGLSTQLHYADSSTVESFRNSVRKACLEDDEKEEEGETNPDRFLVVSYNRKVLGQTGTGHFSPIAAYDEDSDAVLILDTARFKYGAHWVALPLLFEAMRPNDPDTGRSRGYTMLINPNAAENRSQDDDSLLPVPLLLRSEMKQCNSRRELKEFLESCGSTDTLLSDIMRFCTKDGSDLKSVWELTQPQLRPYQEDTESNEIIDEVRQLLQKLLPVENKLNSDGGEYIPDCRPNLCRTLPLRPEEAVLIIYLAFLNAGKRKALLSDPELAASDRAVHQLLAEAELMQYAMDASTTDYNES